MQIIGIDPGKKGGIALLTQNADIVFNIEMPIVNNTIDVKQIHYLLKYYKTEEERICYIERAQSMPKQGVKSTFNYGCGYGMLLSTILLSEIGFEEVSPQTWKKKFALIKKGKEGSMLKCLQLFPQTKKSDFYTERNRLQDGKAEALLIAEYGRRLLYRHD